MRKSLILAVLMLAATPAVACNPAAAGASALIHAATFGLFCGDKPDDVRGHAPRLAREESK